jgi:group I intron endonuclease
MVYGIVYRITNTKNGKIYIGQTTGSLRSRFTGHKYGAFKARKNCHLYYSMRKYGADSFSCAKIDEASSKEELDRLEEKWIHEFVSTDRTVGYNVLPSALDNPMHNTVGQEKIKALWKDPEYRKRQSASRRGIPRDNKWRGNHSRAAHKMWDKPGHRDKISNKAKEWCLTHSDAHEEFRRLGTQKSTEVFAERAKERMEKIRSMVKDHKTLSSMAKEFGITVQALSAFLKTQGERENIKALLRR